MDTKIALVTGTSSGIGLETALSLAREGFKTYASMRNLAKSQTIESIAKSENLSLEVIQLDVTDDSSVHSAVSKIIEIDGRLDVLVNNAGYLLLGAAEDLGIDEIKNQFDTNLFGVYRTIQAVIPQMRKQHEGKIINISSLVGFTGMPFLSAYVSTKFAVEGLTESLRTELESFGIQATVVEPGIIKTNVIEASPIAKKAKEPSSAYFDTVSMMSKLMNEGMEKGSPTSVVAQKVVNAAKSDKLDVRYPAGPDSEQLLQAKRTMSDLDFESVKNQMFAGINTEE